MKKQKRYNFNKNNYFTKVECKSIDCLYFKLRDLSIFYTNISSSCHIIKMIENYFFF